MRLGIALYTYHKYQKSILTPVPLDSATPNAHGHEYSSVRDHEGTVPTRGMPLSDLSRPTSPPTLSYPPPPRETAEDRTQRLRDEFEGWNRSDEWSRRSSEDSTGEEVEADEVERRMTERDGGKGSMASMGAKRRAWGEWWEKEM